MARYDWRLRIIRSGRARFIPGVFFRNAEEFDELEAVNGSAIFYPAFAFSEGGVENV